MTHPTEPDPPFAHGGHIRHLARLAGCRVEELLDFSANINPLGPPSSLRRTLSRHLETVTHYPDPDCRALREAIAHVTALPPEEIVCGNGSTELLYTLPLAFSQGETSTGDPLSAAPIRRAILPVPSYLDYASAVARAGLAITPIPLDARRGFAMDWERVEKALGAGTAEATSRAMVILGQPNNPSGALFDPADLLRVADRHPSTLFVVDEAFMDFVADSGKGIVGGQHDPSSQTGHSTIASNPLSQGSAIEEHRRAQHTASQTGHSTTASNPISQGRTIEEHCRAQRNIIVLRSMTKFHAIPGLRLGYALAPTPLARRLSAYLPPWSVGTLAQAAGVAALEDTAYAHRTRETVARLREGLQGGLADLGGLTVYPSAANYLLVRLDGTDFDAPTLARQLLAHRIAIRVCDNYPGLDTRYFRVAVRTEEENQQLLDTLNRVLSPRSQPDVGWAKAPGAVPIMEGSMDTARCDFPHPTVTTAGHDEAAAERGWQDAGGPKLGECSALHDPISDRPQRRQARFGGRLAPAVMFQGTSSNAGKSILTTALCRILLQDGYRVAPFKAQNMSLNSYVTRDGEEMGRAQVVQAQACRLDPDVRMNPVLLKPNSDTGAQVIVLGKPVGNMDVDAYIRYKPQAFDAVRGAYDALASETDIMVLEGAGSPGEVNLKHHDIVNMAMARHAGARVLLVGDIDRGGVFAAFVGTLEVLGEWERALIAGFVINRFRGRQALLADAMAYVREHTGRPVFGVVPYLPALGLPEEDSVSFKAENRPSAPPSRDHVTIALIDLPHIANFTDFDPLELEPDVHLSIVRDSRQLSGQLGAPDAVILPGSKNVPGDLDWLRAGDLADGILALAGQGVTIVGICGGLQMLGTAIADPHGLESGDGGTRAGLSLLPLRTVLETDKTLKAVSAHHPASGCWLKGYEIHHGHTHSETLAPALVTEGGKAIGFATQDGRISGTYLHGLYDNDLFRRWFIDGLRARRGFAPLGAVQVRYNIEPALDRLADAVREGLDLKRIYGEIGL
uniref:Cobyric acid synthase n=1 Tax=Candidatus Kentrum eta TaxID=2126337 RepID=A0A450V8U5_9GAMM|nr:MAG: adenosylcobyric acid synthase (glutamine-hydrolysing) [Candidatus Kentron sp. H]VFJ94686.1 MAG: adenosylcobyric acid synthase (glutamine-hydrolysing) [Candidatus Kentron sp. H]VFK01218.1 MAG: adenosylcobyric acid synthase (glutamine-hydrolysing) [Candidatus Kentron sp. H]